MTQRRASPPVFLQPRQTMSLLRGPMTRAEIRRARETRAKLEGEAPQQPAVKPEPRTVALQDVAS